MKFSTKEDIAAPIDAVFGMLSDFEYFERAALRRGIDIQRCSPPDTLGIGMAWDAHFELQGKARDLTLMLEQHERPCKLHFDAHSSGLSGKFKLDLEQLAPHRTRLAVAVEVAPKTMSARVLLQPVKLAKNSLTTRFKLRVAEYAKELEERHQRLAGGQSRPASAG